MVRKNECSCGLKKPTSERRYHHHERLPALGQLEIVDVRNLMKLAVPASRRGEHRVHLFQRNLTHHSHYSCTPNYWN